MIKEGAPMPNASDRDCWKESGQPLPKCCDRFDRALCAPSGVAVGGQARPQVRTARRVRLEWES